MKISIKLRVFNDRLFVRSVATGGGGGMGGVQRGSDGGGGQHWGGGQQRGGGVGGGNGGGQQWGCRQPLRTALHNISISFQNNLS